MGLQLVSADYLHEDGITYRIAATASSRISSSRRNAMVPGSIVALIRPLRT